MLKRRLGLMAILLALTSVSAFAEGFAEDALAKMPVKEITVFKDGHVLMLHEGKMPVDASGNVVLDELPSPVLGTFWPYSADPNVKLTAVTAGQRKVRVNHTPMSLPELVRANIGARVLVKANEDYEGTIVEVLDRDHAAAEQAEGTPVPMTPDQQLLLLKIGTGTKVIPLNQISSLLLETPDYKTTLVNEELKNLLTMKLQWPNGKPGTEADVGMMYLQKGIRWIPNYKVTIDGKGQAMFQLQATLINEMTDLKDVTANLVVGVPSFAFAKELDPMGLQKTLAQLSPYFQPNAPSGYAMSNAIMSQEAQMRADAPAPESAAGVPDPEVGGSSKHEDLFIFTVNHLTLKKGDRMVVPIASYAVPYTDVYTLDIPFTPPPEIWRSFAAQQQTEVARLYRAPKVTHTLRISNTSDFPITTAPALLMEDGRVLAQSMAEYTPKGGTLDLALTTAVDVVVKKSDHEVKRGVNAVKWEGEDYARIDLQGSITLTNRRGGPVALEVKRSILGEVDSADNGGATDMLNLFEDNSFLPAGEEGQPSWWGWYSWPGWWSHFNGVGQVSWKTTLEAGKEVTLGYTWHYFWR